MKNLGIIPDLYALPLFFKLREKVDNFNLIADYQINIAKMLREENLHAAFLSPISYAKDHLNYVLIPKLAVSSEGISNVICLYFQENLKEIKTISTDLKNTSEMVLAKLVLMEKYSSNPTFVFSEEPLEKMLEKSDAALIVGNANLQLKHYKNKLDLVDEWSDMMELPYVHGIWVTRKNKLSDEEVKMIIDLGNNGANNLTEIANQFSEEQEETLDYLLNFSYQLNDNAKYGLIEFIRMAYYYDIIDDLPDFEYLQEKDSNPSVN